MKTMRTKNEWPLECPVATTVQLIGNKWKQTASLSARLTQKYLPEYNTLYLNWENPCARFSTRWNNGDYLINDHMGNLVTVQKLCPFLSLPLIVFLLHFIHPSVCRVKHFFVINCIMGLMYFPSVGNR